MLLGAFYYGHTSSLQFIRTDCCIPRICECYIFAGDGLIYVPCSGEYFECAILLDRLYFGCVLNALGNSVPRHDVLWLDL